MSFAKTSRIKGIFLSLMVFLMASMGVLLPAEKANAADVTVNERVAAFIEMMQNKQEGESEEDLKITQDELQFLGVFLSNYYTPFYTELGVGANEEDMKETQEAMQEVLENVLAFNPTTAKNLVNIVLNQIRTNSQPLKWGFSKDDVLYSGVNRNSSPSDTQSQEIRDLKEEISELYDQGNHAQAKIKERELSSLQREEGSGTSSSGSNSTKTLTSTKIDVVEADVEPPNVLTFLEMASGRTRNSDQKRLTEIFDLDGVNETLIKANAIDGGYNYAHLLNEENQPVFSMRMFNAFTSEKEVPTPSQSAFLIAVNSISGSIKNTYLASALDIRMDETGNKTANELAQENSVEDVADLSHMLDSQLYISPFGDIINVGRMHQVVLIPGALNPYTWKNVNDKGEDTSVLGAGMAANYFTMAAFKDGDFTSLKSSKFNGIEQAYYRYTQRAKSYSDNLIASGAIHQSDWTISPAAGQKHSSWGDGWFTNTFKGGQANKVKKTIEEKARKEYPEAYRPRTYNAAHTNSPIQKFNGSVDHKAWGLPYLMNMVYFDDLQQHVDSEDKISMVPMYANGKLHGELVNDTTNPFFQQQKTIGTSSPKSIYERTGQRDAASLYVTYAIAGIYNKDKKAETIGELGFRINDGLLPTIKGSDVSELQLESSSDDQILRDIRHWTWYLLNPTEGLRYVTTLVSNKVAAFVMGWHTDMVGTDGIGIMPGSTRYTGFSGYVTTPALSDIEWLDSLTNFYHDILIYIIIGVAALMGLYAITSVLTVQQAIAGAILFAVLAWVPAPLINFVIDTSNTISSKIYNSKFSYWSLLQHQSYTSLMDQAANEDNYEEYLRTLHAANQDLASPTPEASKNRDNMGGNSIIVKWQAPKKMASLNLSSEVGETEDNESYFRTTGLIGANLNAMIEKTFSGETFTGNPQDVYLFRNYTDLGNWSRFIYKAYGEGDNFHTKVPSTVQEAFSPSLKNSWNTRKEDNLSSSKAGTQSNMSKKWDDNISVTRFLMSPIYTEAYTDQIGKVPEADINTLLGIDQRLFAFDMGDFTKSSEKGKDYFCEEVIARADEETGFEKCGGYTSKDIGSLAAYGLYSESPFFFFSWNLYDQGMNTEIGGENTGGFKDLILKGGGGQYFFNNPYDDGDTPSFEEGETIVIDENDANGGMKDFLNMRYLFKYVIPHMRMGNDVVKEYFDIYGLRIYKGISLKEGQQEKYEDDPVLKQQYWHNLNVARLYNIYSPWVDLIDSSKYGESETIQYMGENKTIENPLDPFNYPKDRPMVFSESEMRQYGLEEYQLTSAEKKIQEITKETQKDYIDLLNYYNYHDSVINTAAAMHATFNFNSAFSHSGLGQGIQLYPQGYELNNFTYDAFMRLILANSTGYDVTQSVETDYYTDLVQQSSITTAILLIANDVVAIYLLPGLKLFFVVGIFLASIIMLFASAIRVEENIVKNSFKSLVFPLAKYLAATVGFAFLISLFMSGGATGVTGEEGVTIKFGDPALTLLILLVVNVIMAYVYFKIVWSVLKDLKKYTTASVKSVGGVFSGIGSSVAGSVSGESKSSGGGGIGQKARGIGSAAVGAAAGAAGAAAAMRSRKKMQNSKNPNFTAQDKYRDKAQEQAERRKKKGFVRRKVDESGWKERINGSVQAGYGHIQKAVGEANIRMSRGRWGHNLKTKGVQRVEDGRGQKQRGLDKASSVYTKKDIRQNTFKQESQQRKEERRKKREQRQEERKQRRQKSKKDE